MNTNDIVRQIDTEVSHLQQAKAILIGVAPRRTVQSVPIN